MLVDVEGHAGEVLRGSSDLLANYRIPIICEIHSEIEENAVLKIMSSRAVVAGKSSRFPYHTVIS